MSSKKFKNANNRTLLEVIFLGFFKFIWWLISLPFKGLNQNRKTFDAEKHRYIVSKRNEIISLADSKNPYELRHAIMEADKLVDYILKNKNYSGESFSDRLRHAERFINQDIYQAIWDGHKIRNLVAHDDNQVSDLAIRSAIKKLIRYTYE